ncbi:amino acid permease [Lentisphaerota bacterium WC36G]|nr:amino acid permease [Lentisphaerae bacterium WC36]
MRLSKNLKFIDVFCISAGVMVSSGIFILPGLAFDLTGPAVFVSYVLAGVIALIGVMSVTELATAMPKAGGDYYFITRSMGPLIGTIEGILSWFAIALKSAFAIFGLSEVTHAIIPSLDVYMVGCFWTIGFMLINIVGVKAAAKFETYLVIVLLIILVLFVIRAFNYVEVAKFTPFVKDDNSWLILSTTGTVFISFGGLLTVSSIAEEVKNPQRNIPLGIISSIIVVTLLYGLILIVLVGVMDTDVLAHSVTPIADCGKIINGDFGYYTIMVAAFLAFVTTANAGILAASRYPLALSRDSLIPEFMAKINQRVNTPIYSILATGLFIMIALMLPLEDLVKAASSIILTSQILTNLAVIILRESKVQNYQPSFRSPLYPYLQIAGIVIFAALIYDMGLRAITVSLSGILFSLIAYLIYGRKATKEYALLHVIERLTNRKLTSHSLETELKEIIHSRDNIVMDDIDKLIEESFVLDLSSTIEAGHLFAKIAEDLPIAEDLKITQKELCDLFSEREEQSSTVLSPFVAIPHIITENENYFKIILVRNSAGVTFANEEHAVKALFIIVGSLDQRNLHLRTLAALAQIIQNRHFEERWLNANGELQLKDILIVSKRKRSF